MHTSGHLRIGVRIPGSQDPGYSGLIRPLQIPGSRDSQDPRVPWIPASRPPLPSTDSWCVPVASSRGQQGDIAVHHHSLDTMDGGSGTMVQCMVDTKDALSLVASTEGGMHSVTGCSAWKRGCMLVLHAGIPLQRDIGYSHYPLAYVQPK